MGKWRPEVMVQTDLSIRLTAHMREEREGERKVRLHVCKKLKCKATFFMTKDRVNKEVRGGERWDLSREQVDHSHRG